MADGEKNLEEVVGGYNPTEEVKAEVLSKMTFHERSDSLEKFMPAYVKVYGAMQTLKKNRQGYGYKYADLASVLEMVRPELAKNGMVALQPLNSIADGVVEVKTILLHVSGQYVSCNFVVRPTNLSGKPAAIQMMGASITYARRYTLASLLGLSSEDDTDGSLPEQQPRDLKRGTNAKRAEPQKPLPRNENNEGMEPPAPDKVLSESSIEEKYSAGLEMIDELLGKKEDVMSEADLATATAEIKALKSKKPSQGNLERLREIYTYMNQL